MDASKISPVTAAAAAARTPRQSPVKAQPSVTQVARELLYSADRVYDGTIDARDGVHGGKLSRALRTMAGADTLGLDGVRQVVSQFAGTDGRVENGEYRDLAAAIRTRTSHMRAHYNKFAPATEPTFDNAARWFVGQADVNHDGRIDGVDTNAANNSDLARTLLEGLQVSKLDLPTLSTFISKYEPDQEPARRITDFSNTVYDFLFQRNSMSLSVHDFARAGVNVFDRDRNTTLTRADGKLARHTIKDAGGLASMRAADIAKVYSKYDTIDDSQPANPKPGHDNRLNVAELTALIRAEDGPAAARNASTTAAIVRPPFATVTH